MYSSVSTQLQAVKSFLSLFLITEGDSARRHAVVQYLQRLIKFSYLNVPIILLGGPYHELGRRAAWKPALVGPIRLCAAREASLAVKPAGLGRDIIVDDNSHDGKNMD